MSYYSSHTYEPEKRNPHTTSRRGSSRTRIKMPRYGNHPRAPKPQINIIGLLSSVDDPAKTIANALFDELKDWFNSSQGDFCRLNTSVEVPHE